MEGVGVTVLEAVPRECGDCVRTWRATGPGPLTDLAFENMVHCGLWYGALSCSLKDKRMQLLALGGKEA